EEAPRRPYRVARLEARGARDGQARGEGEKDELRQRAQVDEGIAGEARVERGVGKEELADEDRGRDDEEDGDRGRDGPRPFHFRPSACATTRRSSSTTRAERSRPMKMLSPEPSRAIRVSAASGVIRAPSMPSFWHWAAVAERAMVSPT